MKWPKEFPIVHVEWIDSTACSGWHDRHETEDFVDEDDWTMKSLGFLVKNNETMVVLAQSVGGQHLGELLKIPTQNVRKMYQISSPVKKKRKRRRK